jgi:predicted permease
MLRRIPHFFAFLFRRRQLEDDLDEELRSSFEMIVDRLIAQGLPPAEARRRARLEFGGFEQVKESVRDGLVGFSLETSLRDVRYAWRGLCRRPSLAPIAVVTLALGIGVNAAIFSVFYAVLLRPLPYDRPEQLAMIFGSFRAAGNARAPVSAAMLSEIARRNRSLAGVAGMWVGTQTFPGEPPEQVRVAQVTPNFFDVLGVDAARGRTFVKDEEAGERPAIILTDGFFRRRFAANPARIGKPLDSRLAATLVGVLPAGFQLHLAPDTHVPADVPAFIPFPYDIYSTPRDLYFLRLIARLKPGISMVQAQRDLDRVSAEIRGAYTIYNAENLRFSLASMQADAVRDLRPALTALFAGASFLLLICCVNVTSLLLARAADRRREIALRLAIGASRGRIVRQLLAEGAVLCLIGGSCGMALGWAGFRVLLAIRPERLAHISDAGMHWPMLAFAGAVSLGAALLFGLAPAIGTFRLDLTESLRSGGRGWIGALNRRAGAALVIGEITIAFVLVTGAALAARTLAKIEQVNPGFQPRHRLTFQISFGSPLSPDVPLRSIRDWEAELAALPGVERVGATSHLPLDDFPNWYSPYRPEGISASDAATLIADHRSVTPGYFAAMGTRLLQGRYFDSHDRAESRSVIIVDDLLARTTWPGESAIGKKVEVEHVAGYGFAPVSSIVVGVVEHVRNHSLTRQVRGEIYIPFEQSPRSPLSYVLRTSVEPLSLVPAIRRLLHRRDPSLALAKVRPMTDYIAREIAPVGFTAVLAAIFSALALVLAAAGIYGVLNYQVSRRLPEMGVRMAVGAGARDIFRLVLRHALALSAAGALLGALSTILAARWLSALVYGISPRDPLSFALALLLLPAVALLGCWRPAARAAAADPAQTMRAE